MLPGIDLLFSQVLCSSFPGFTGHYLLILLPCCVPGQLNIMAELKASILLSFCCVLPVADTAEERDEDQRGGEVGIFTLQPQQTTLESIHILAILVCVPVCPHTFFFFNPKLLPWWLVMVS